MKQPAMAMEINGEGRSSCLKAAEKTRVKSSKAIWQALARKTRIIWNT